MTLIAEQTYRLSGLLRGLNNSDDMMMETVPAGSRVVVLDGGLAALSIDSDYIGEALEIAVNAAGRAGVAAQHSYSAAHLRPLSVVHVTAEPAGEGVRVSWIPRNLDGSDVVDDAAQAELTWPDGAVLVTGTSATLPVLPGSQTEISIRPFAPIGGFGRSVRIRV